MHFWPEGFLVLDLGWIFFRAGGFIGAVAIVIDYRFGLALALFGL